MKGLENQTYLIAWIISNIAALLILLAACRSARLARILFFLLFAWACWINWKTAMYSPEDYQEYASLSFLDYYKSFIGGWFHNNTLLVVGCIATCQGFIAISMLLKGNATKFGIAGAIIFLIAIAPLGVGSGFPTTITMAIALFIILTKGVNEHPWRKPLPHAAFIETVD